MHKPHLLICYKNFSKETDISHIGMGVTAAYCAKTLHKHGICAQARPIFGADDLTSFIISQEKEHRPITHVIIFAPWMQTKYIAGLCRKFTNIQFLLNCHSNVAFLQAEPNAITLIREAIDLQTGISNFNMGGNNKKFCTAMKRMYGQPLTFMPNLYYLHGKEPIHRPPYNGGTLKIGVFGSLRIYKNIASAVASGIELTQSMKCDSEIWINTGRDDGAGNIVHRAAVALTKNLPHVKLKTYHWSAWPEFKRHIGAMDIHIAPSFSESFCNVIADGITEGVGSVVSKSVDWVPRSWFAESDESSDVAITARRILNDHYAAQDGYAHLRRYVRDGLHYWKEFLGC